MSDMSVLERVDSREKLVLAITYKGFRQPPALTDIPVILESLRCLIEVGPVVFAVHQDRPVLRDRSAEYPSISRLSYNSPLMMGLQWVASAGGVFTAARGLIYLWSEWEDVSLKHAENRTYKAALRAIDANIGRHSLPGAIREGAADALVSLHAVEEEDHETIGG